MRTYHREEFPVTDKYSDIDIENRENFNIKRKTIVKGELFMPLNELLKELFSKIGRMTNAEFTDLLGQTEDPNEKELYYAVFNTILQQKQREVIKANKF